MNLYFSVKKSCSAASFNIFLFHLFLQICKNLVYNYINRCHKVPASFIFALIFSVTVASHYYPTTCF